MRRKNEGRTICIGVAALLLFAGVAHAQSPAQGSLQQLIGEAQQLMNRRDFNASLNRYGVAYSAVEQLSDPAFRSIFRVIVQLGIASDLAALHRYQEALPHIDAALAEASQPQSRTPPALSAAMHHVRGAVLYSLGRRDEARAMFELAAHEGDARAGSWLKATAAPR